MTFELLVCFPINKQCEAICIMFLPIVYNYTDRVKLDKFAAVWTFACVYIGCLTVCVEEDLSVTTGEILPLKREYKCNGRWIQVDCLVGLDIDWS